MNESTVDLFNYRCKITPTRGDFTMKDNIETIRTFNRFYANYFNHFEKELYHDFPSMNEARVMAYLYFNQPRTAKNIQEQLGFDKGQLSKMLTKLEKQNVLTRQLDPSDRRHYQLQLTKLGENLHQELATKSHHYLSQHFSDFNTASLTQIANDLSEAEKLLAKEEKVTVRKGTLADIGYIADLHSRVYQNEIVYNHIFHSYVFDSLATYTKDMSKGVVFIAQFAQKRVGTVSLVMDKDNNYQLRWFAVDPQFQGLGIGTKLLKELMNYVKEKNITEIYLWTVDELKGARKLYHSVGFKKIESTPNSEWSNRKINEEKWLWKK